MMTESVEIQADKGAGVETEIDPGSIVEEIEKQEEPENLNLTWVHQSIEMEGSKLKVLRLITNSRHRILESSSKVGFRSETKFNQWATSKWWGKTQ